MPPKGPKAPPKAGGKKGPPPAMLAKLKAQMARQKALEEEAIRQAEEEERLRREEERILAAELRAEEQEREANKEAMKEDKKEAKKAGKRDAKMEALERMRAAGFIVPDLMNDEERAKLREEQKAKAKADPPKPKPKKAVEEVKEKKEISADEIEDWEQLAEIENEKEAEEAAKADEIAKAETAAKASAAEDEAHVGNLRSPICCIMGHVDTGKTSLLDKIRSTNVQGAEAGGITQQIGATFFPRESIVDATAELNKKYQHDLKVPGLLVIDTPGHESFTNLRSRGSSLCDIAVLVVDIMHGLEPQTRESMRLLRERRCPYIVALNKVDRLLDWEAHKDMDIEQTLSLQKEHVKQEFESRTRQILLEFAQEGINAEIYWRNDDVKKVVSVVPTSAKSGEGICDLLLLKIQLVQRFMEGKVSYKNELQCTVLEVKPIQGIGTTIDVVLVNGVLHEGDDIVVCGLSGPIVTQVRALLTPQPMKELRVKGEYVHHKKLRAAIGVKISAHNLEEAVPGTPLLVVKPGDDVEAIKREVSKELTSITNNVATNGIGVAVQSSTLGSMEALLSFLSDSKIPVSSIALGPMHKKHLNGTLAMKARNPKYAVVLAFDVAISREAAEVAAKNDIPIFSAKIIYHLFDSFTAYCKQYEQTVIEKNRKIAIFPVILKDLQKIRNKDPIIVGATVQSGQLHLGTPLCTFEGGKGPVISIGKVVSMENNEKEVKIAKVGDTVAVKINAADTSICFGRQFMETSMLYSMMTRASIDALKLSFRDQVSTDEWKLVKWLKGPLNVV